MTAVAKKLSRDERHELEKCEAAITLYSRQFLAVGEALLRIARGKLYREEYDSFEAYLGARWPDIGRRKAYHLVALADVHEDVPAVLNQRQARSLIGVPKEERPAVWEEAAAEAGGEPGGDKLLEVADRRALERMGPAERLEVVRAEEGRLIEGAAAIRPPGRRRRQVWDDCERHARALVRKLAWLENEDLADRARELLRDVSARRANDLVAPGAGG